ncbi:hypothetical protein H6F67_02450 [Microcoleus sp. FACHB-1515]|uniref:hypothetical protein n=1 Tax=Cyanophyceae TaxID=3028117 RepID=UPI0016841E29|nr:hypothetical protein [Microcoleus sp. FACHB-1515]MBD2088722.1 hypothetical protein [Microcoleus sp. FACHB-1515]
MTDPKPSTKVVTLHLPIEIVASIARLSRELEQPQSEILVYALRRGLEFLSLQSEPSSDWAQLADRLTALEALPAQVAELQAEVDRLLQTSAQASAASAVNGGVPNPDRPAPAAPVEVDRCPRCDHKLNAPLKSSGRQVCIKCGWTNKPRTAASADPAPDEIQRLLNQAAADAIANMKPKKSASVEPKKFPFGLR